MKTPAPQPCIRHTTPLGEVLLRASEQGLNGLWFTAQRHHPAPQAVASWPVSPFHPLLREATQQLDAWFTHRRTYLDLPLDLSGGTAFQRSVWNALLRIPYGTRSSYRELAQVIGRPLAVRAVGAAVGRNPLSIVVPCHRVVGSDGSLTGYAGGLERKFALLSHEAALIEDGHQSRRQTASKSDDCGSGFPPH